MAPAALAGRWPAREETSINLEKLAQFAELMAFVIIAAPTLAPAHQRQSKPLLAAGLSAQELVFARCIGLNDGCLGWFARPSARTDCQRLRRGGSLAGFCGS